MVTPATCSLSSTCSVSLSLFTKLWYAHSQIYCSVKLGVFFAYINIFYPFYRTALKGCQGIVFTHGVRVGRQAGGGKKFVRAVSWWGHWLGCVGVQHHGLTLI